MRIRTRVGKLPEGNQPYTGASAAVRRLSDASTIQSVPVDSNGWIDLQRDGHLEPYFLHISGVPGGDKFIRSDDVMATGAFSLAEVPVALRALGDGVVRGYGGELAVSAGVDSVTVATGGANVAGHPFVTYAVTSLPYTRPAVSTRIDRVIIRLSPEGSGSLAGKADLVLLAGAEGGSAPALTQTAEVHEVGLAAVTIPTVGTVTLADERTFTNERAACVVQVDRVAGATTTTSAGGEALAGFSESLVLPKAITYLVTGSVTARQDDVASTSAWTLLSTYGPTFNSLAMSNPGQVAVDSTGRILIADTGNNRLIRINGTTGGYIDGITGLTGITGVCVDSSDNIYVCYDVPAQYPIRKYNGATLAVMWTINPGPQCNHLATDGTTLWATRRSTGWIQRFLTSTGAPAGPVIGSFGTATGQFNNPWGITYSTIDTVLYVADSGNNRVQLLTTSGAFVTAITGFSAPRGVISSQPQEVLVADYGNDAVKRVTDIVVSNTVTTLFSQTDPSGVAVATGDVIWTNNTTTGTIAQWDEAITPGGYGQVAVEIDGDLGAYLGIGQREGTVRNAHELVVAGPDTVVVRAFGKATLETMTLKRAVLTARAEPHR